MALGCDQGMPRGHLVAPGRRTGYGQCPVSIGCDCPLRSGNPCAISAVGRCPQCERAYCESHRDLPSVTWEPVLCAVCGTQRRQRAAELLDRTATVLAVSEEFKRNDRTNYPALLDRLITSVPNVAVDVYITTSDTEGFRRRRVQRPEFYGRSWPLGQVELQGLDLLNRLSSSLRDVAVLRARHHDWGFYEYALKNADGYYERERGSKEASFDPRVDLKKLLREAAELHKVPLTEV
jgi:hypothetical protein